MLEKVGEGEGNGIKDVHLLFLRVAVAAMWRDQGFKFRKQLADALGYLVLGFHLKGITDLEPRERMDGHLRIGLRTERVQLLCQGH